MGERGTTGGAWGARDDTSWWPGNTGDLQHQQQMNEEIARSTAASTHQLYTYKVTNSFPNNTADNSNTNYEYRIISSTNNREETAQQPWWFATGSVESQQVSSSPTTAQNQSSPDPDQGNQISNGSLQQQQQHQEQNQTIQQMQQQHNLQQALQQQNQSLQQSLQQQVLQQQNQQQSRLQQLQQQSQQQIQQNNQQNLQQALQQQSQNLQQSLQQSQQQTLQHMLQQQQQQQQQVLQQAIQQQTLTQAQAQALVQQAQAALQQQVTQSLQQQTLQEQIQAAQQQHIHAALQRQSNIQEQQQQQVPQALINQPASKPRMPRARALNKPRGRMTAYAFFVQTCREEHKKKHPDGNVIFTAFSKKCAERWSTMSEKEKQRFHEMAEQDKQRYDIEMQNYVPPKDIKLPRGRKRNQTKDPNAPKRSLSAFFWFCNDERSKVKGENPEYTMGDIAKELGRRWAAAEPETKSKYESLSEQDKARYEREMTAYKKGPLALVQQQPFKDETEVDPGNFVLQED